MTDMTHTLKLINDCDEEVHFERQVKRELLRLHDLLGKANALARIRATRIEELEAQLYTVGAGGVGPLMPVVEQQPTAEESSAVQQPQGEQGPVAWIWAEWSSRKLTFDGLPAVPSVRDELTKPVWTPLYTHSQPPHQPVTNEQMDIGWELHGSGDAYQAWCMAVEWTERAHGIKEQK